MFGGGFIVIEVGMELRHSVSWQTRKQADGANTQSSEGQDVLGEGHCHLGRYRAGGRGAGGHACITSA